MDKDVFVTIKGIHTTNNDTDDTEILIPGEYYFRNNKHFICYEEVSEPDGEKTKSVMKISNNMVELIKRGSSVSRLIFEKDKKNYSLYNTGMGDLYLCVDTSDIQMITSEDERRIDVKINYSLEINQQKVSDCEVNIVVSSDSML